MNATLRFKVKLASGRVLGPLDLERIRQLILANQIHGTEKARRHPDGEWMDINLHSEIADLLIAKAEGKLGDLQVVSTDPERASTQILPGSSLMDAEAINLEALPELEEPSLTSTQQDAGTRTMVAPEGDSGGGADGGGDQGGDDDRTKVDPFERDEKTVSVQLDNSHLIHAQRANELKRAHHSDDPAKWELPQLSGRKISEEKTIVFERSEPPPPTPQEAKRFTPRKLVRLLGVAVLGLLVVQELLSLQPSKPLPDKLALLRPKLPSSAGQQTDPMLSQKLYVEAMKHYVQDTVPGYLNASKILLAAAGKDMSNVKALAMLASSYLNLIDSSNKDENYFSVISKLIELSRAKSVDLPETVIADVEFFVMTNNAEAAQRRIVEYTKRHKNFGLEMFFYLAYAFYERGDAQNAGRYLSQFPDDKVYSPRIFYLRGMIAEKLGLTDEALLQYQQAVKFQKSHAKSHLRIAEIRYQQGALKEAAPHLDLMVKNPRLLPPKLLGRAYYLHSQLNSVNQKWDYALGDVERAVKLDPENHDYLLELYTLRGRLGDQKSNAKAVARMYYFLSEGEKHLKKGDFQGALVEFIQAKQAEPKSALPPRKMGDMFVYLNDMANARRNYEEAVQLAPNDIEVWSKYIQTLIVSFEWEEAQKAMTKLRKLPVSASAVDKLAGDMYARQGRHVEAQAFYKKAMSRDVIDSKVYRAYAESLLETKQYQDAAFFFALALRFDPLNADSLIGTAKTIAASDSVERAIAMLQDELSKGSAGRSELLSAVAEFQIQEGEWTTAEKTIEQAMKADPEYAYPWKLQAQIYMNREGQDKSALEKALLAYKSYSDRNTSDPSGYLERYRIFVKQAKFEKAAEELNKVFAIYPKYPALHYYKGALYTAMANHRAAVDEYNKELANNPGSIDTILALGKAYIDLGAAEQALEQFTKAMQMAPQAPEPKHLAGYANYLLKNYQGAIALYRAALAFDRANPLIHKRLGLAYLDVGDRDQAREAFREYLRMEPDAPDKNQFLRYL